MHVYMYALSLYALEKGRVQYECMELIRLYATPDGGYSVGPGRGVADQIGPVGRSEPVKF